MATRFLNPPTGFVAKFFGPYTASPTAYTYFVRANFPEGQSLLVSSTVNVSTLTRGVAVVQLSWDPAPGAISYDVLRHTATTLSAQGSYLLKAAHDSTNFTDDGSISPSSYYPSFGGGNLRVWHATLSFAIDGGAVSTITPADSDLIPANAILVGGQVNVTTAVTSAGSATVGIGTSAGSSTTALLAATAKATLSLDALINAVPTFAAAVKMTAAGQITFTVATAALTAGIIEVWIIGFIAEVS